MKPQTARALAHANAIRLRRAELKRLVAAGDRTVLDVLDEPALERLPIYDLLTWQHRWAGVRARKLLNEGQIGERRQCGHLTARERTELRLLLGGDTVGPT